MPSKKGRSIVQPVQTLHHFFRTAAPQRQKLDKSNTLANSSRTSISQEIIVIDSDDDDEVEILASTKPVKRRRLSADPRLKAETLSDIIIPLNTKSLPSSGPSSSGSSVKLSDSNENTYSGVEVSKNALYAPTENNPMFSFGCSDLLLSSNVRNKEPVQNYSFGQPSALLQGNPRDASHPSIVNHSSEESPSFCQTNDVDIDLTLEDWENDDSERSFKFRAEDAYNGPSELSTDHTEKSAMSNSRLFPSSSTMISQRTLVNYDAKYRLGRQNAFSVLMSSVKENEVWKEGSIDKTYGPPQAGGRRKAPFYKILQGMPIAVDAFNFGKIPGVTAYFLSHAHSDHYTSLSSKWNHGPIYCSEGTANLVTYMLSVDKKWVHPLPMDTPSLIPNTNGVTVTLIEANHCPGSCLFFFEGPQTVNAGDSNFRSHFIGSFKIFRYLHCGDFRASPRHILHPAVHEKLIDHVYLDTTYLDPKYTFPPQPLVIAACAELSKRIIFNQPLYEEKTGLGSWMSFSKGKGTKNAKTNTLIVVGTYTIGKERVVKAIAQALNSKVYCDARKSAVLRCQADHDLNALLTSNPMDAIVHLAPLSMITTDRLKAYLDRFKGSYDKIIGFRPTGWTYSPAAGTDQLPSLSSIISRSSQKEFTCADLQLLVKPSSPVLIYPVPYSEHSSFYELTCFAMSFNWTKMIATVNVGSEASRRRMFNWISRWEAERKKRGKDIIIDHRHPDYW